MINKKLREYIQDNIISKYMEFDEAHDFYHVENVINNSMYIAKDYGVNMNMVYVIATYHDIGLIDGRENHEKKSSELLSKDQILKNWFSSDEIICMAEAVEDHRASNDYEPRSIYGKIISEADRDIEYERILLRTIQYSLTKYPEYTFDEHYNRTFKHIENKYGENGYMKLYLKTEQNTTNLNILRNKIKDTEDFKRDFKNIFYSNC